MVDRPRPGHVLSFGWSTGGRRPRIVLTGADARSDARYLVVSPLDNGHWSAGPGIQEREGRSAKQNSPGFLRLRIKVFLRAVYGSSTGRGPQSVATLRRRSFRLTAAITRARPAIECALCNSTRRCL